MGAPDAHAFAMSPGWDESFAVLWRSCQGPCRYALAIQTRAGTTLTVPALAGSAGPLRELVPVPHGWVALLGEQETPVFVSLDGTLRTLTVSALAPDPQPGDVVVNRSPVPLLVPPDTDGLPGRATVSGVPTAQDFPIQTACLAGDSLVGAGTTQRVGPGVVRATVIRYVGGSQWQAGTVDEPDSRWFVPTTVECNGPHAVAMYTRVDGAAAGIPAFAFRVTHDAGRSWVPLDLTKVGLGEVGGATITDTGTVLVTDEYGRLARIPAGRAGSLVQGTAKVGWPMSRAGRLYASDPTDARMVLRSTDDGLTWVALPLPGAAPVG